ncbi:hypothetical protein [Oceanobacter mangrovi]|uniref:VpaChn25_0724 family phage protein n=1 Tax=Oceanobacter mangrovi TaxID=2862510 RepID=UPI001C8EBEE6|nr:hypothetical protein [Oceanobacter mangrovi]
MSFLDRVAASQRLYILQLLKRDAGYSHNQHILAAGLTAAGHSISTDEVREHIRWLENAALLAVKDVHGIGLVATINDRGVEVTEGRLSIDGIERPRPGEL